MCAAAAAVYPCISKSPLQKNSTHFGSFALWIQSQYQFVCECVHACVGVCDKSIYGEIDINGIYICWALYNISRSVQTYMVTACAFQCIGWKETYTHTHSCTHRLCNTVNVGTKSEWMNPKEREGEKKKAEQSNNTQTVQPHTHTHTHTFTYANHWIELNWIDVCAVAEASIP